MTAEERILALLCCRLGDAILPLTLSQYDSLRRKAGVPLQTEETVLALCEGKEQERICRLLERGKTVQERLSLWSSKGVEVCTVLSPDYPENLRKSWVRTHRLCCSFWEIGNFWGRVPFLWSAAEISGRKTAALP